MTPGARVQAAIDILGPVLRGAPAEREATRWARGARYAGSGDRAAVRDLVFDALRRLRSSAWLGGQGEVAVEAMEARRVVAGLLRGQGRDPADLFTGAGHAPAPLGAAEAAGPPLDAAPDGVRLDLPDWVLARLRAAEGDVAEGIAAALRARAPVHLRANLARGTRADLIERLADHGIAAAAHPAAPGAVALEGAPRGLDRLPEFAAGLFELQDAGSQTLVEGALEGIAPGRVLDLCAGGGGKALAVAARWPEAEIVAHDADPARLAALPPRAARAGARIALSGDPEGPFDLVIADVPCSGSGAWRRAPEAKWRLTPERLADLCATQAALLDRARHLVRPGGRVAYMTCSVLSEENGGAVEAALARHGDLAEARRIALRPGESRPEGNTDGFFLSVLHRG